MLERGLPPPRIQSGERLYQDILNQISNVFFPTQIATSQSKQPGLVTANEYSKTLSFARQHPANNLRIGDDFRIQCGLGSKFGWGLRLGLGSPSLLPKPQMDGNSHAVCFVRRLPVRIILKPRRPNPPK